MLKWGMGLALAVLAHGAASAGSYQIHEVTRSGYDSIWLRDVNNAGQMLGGADARDGTHVSFIYANQQFTDLPSFGEAGLNFYGRGISDGGVIVGSAWNKAGLGKGAIYENGQYQIVLPNDAAFSNLVSISPNGRFVTGDAWTAGDASSDGNPYRLYSFILDRQSGSMQKFPRSWTQPINALRGINDQGLIAASTRYGTGILFNSADGSFSGSHTWQGMSVSSYDISNSGLLVGYAEYANDDLSIVRTQALVGSVNHLEALDLPAQESIAYGVNDSGVVVGAFSLVDHLIDEHAPYRAFYAISNVPEPAQGLMLAAGLFAVLLAARRQRTQA